jgi:CHAD domain-containing protein
MPLPGSSFSHESAYVVRGDVSTDTITESLQALLPARHDGLARQRFTVLDTFDARLRRAGARLTHSDRRSAGTYAVAWQPRGERSSTFRLAEPPGFVWDVPRGPLQHGLAPIVGVRRLLAQADAEAHGSQLEILDGRRKIVARLRIQSGRVRPSASSGSWRRLPTIVTLTALRGYGDAFRRLVPVLESRPGMTLAPEGLHGAILDRAGARAPVSFPLDLAPSIRAEAGAREIHRTLLAMLTANEPGVRADLDTEFLHDFRVALRRTRSLLGQLKHVFPPAAVEHFRTELTWIARLTGPARDLDVLTLAIRTGPDATPAGTLEELMVLLHRARQAARGTFLEGLDSRRYRTLLSEWRSFLDQPASTELGAPNAGEPLAEVVARRAWRLSRRIAASAKTIDRHSSADELHDVRIIAKKLRYLVDVTPSFFDARDLAAVVGALKKLQAVLGDFNDACVQEARLTELRRGLAASGASPAVLRTLGRLADDRRRRQQQLRADVGDRLARFSGRATQAACRRAFEPIAVPPGERVP